MITNQYLKEQDSLLLTAYKFKENLNLILTSGRSHCLDVNLLSNYISDENIKIIIKSLKDNNLIRFNNIYLDSRYISNSQAEYIQKELNKEVIIKVYNNNKYKDYQNFIIYNYINDINFYNENVKNFYILSDDNINIDIIGKENLEVLEYNLTIFNEEVKKIFTWQEFNKLNLPYNEYRKWVFRDNCFANDSLTIDVDTLNIIICPALNEKAFTLGKIYENEIVATHADIAVRVISSPTKDSKLQCCNCELYSVCKQQCYYHSYLTTQDPFLKDDNNCKFSLKKAKFFATLYDKAGIRQKAIENKDIELLTLINKYLFIDL